MENTRRAASLYGADISGTLDKGETEFVLAVMRLATGAHPFAAIRLLTLAVIELRRHDVAGEPAGDDRKPWVEPTVTELARHPASATLTIAGVDLPNPAPTPMDTASAVRWLRARADMQPARAAEFEAVARIVEGAGAEIERLALGIDAFIERLPTQADNGELYFDQLVSEIPADWALDGYLSRMHEVAEMARIGRSLIGVVDEVTRPGGEGCEDLKEWMADDSPIEIVAYLLKLVNDRDAEISELQGMLEEAIGPVRFVSELATLTDTEVDFMGVGEIRAAARGKIGEPYGFTLPRLYGEADRERAIRAALPRFYNPSQPPVRMGPAKTGELVDVIAKALGLQRAC